MNVKIVKTQPIVFIVSLFLITGLNLVWAEEYKVPKKLGKIAARYNAKALMVKGITYQDFLASVNVVAEERAKILGRRVTTEDYEFALASWCIPVPNWPKEPPEEDFQEGLKRLASRASADAGQRREIRNRLRKDLLGLSRVSFRERHLSVAAIFDDPRELLQEK